MRRRLIIVFILLFSFTVCAQAAPCYGTKMPEKKKFFCGLQTHVIFKRYLEGEYGKLRSTQHFLLLSYGISNWLSLDLKGGAGNMKQHPAGRDEVDYPSSFNGGYGFRLKPYDKENLKMVFGFQHISVHPKAIRLGATKHGAVLDDWQVSFLASRYFKKINPYLGAKFSRVDYIHWIEEDRKRVMSDLTKCFGLVSGADFMLGEGFWVNLEGQFFDAAAAALSINLKF